MQVEMTVVTVWNGQRLRPGDLVDVDAATAARWRRRGLAAGPPEGDETQGMTIRELRERAAERGIDLGKARTRAEILELLNAPAPEEPEAAPEGEPSEAEPAAEPGPEA